MTQDLLSMLQKLLDPRYSGVQLRTEFLDSFLFDANSRVDTLQEGTLATPVYSPCLQCPGKLGLGRKMKSFPLELRTYPTFWLAKYIKNMLKL